jgi:hypothetical protein
VLVSVRRLGWFAAAAVGLVGGLVVGDASRQAVPENFEPAVGQGAQGHVAGFAGGDLAVVELPGPNAGTAPVNRRSGKRDHVVAKRQAYNRCLGDAVHQWAFCSLSHSAEHCNAFGEANVRMSSPISAAIRPAYRSPRPGKLR